MSEYIKKSDVLKILNGAVDKYPISFLNGIGASRKEISNMPAADVVEVRHGEWGFDGVGFTCSECGKYALSIKTKIQPKT